MPRCPARVWLTFWPSASPYCHMSRRAAGEEYLRDTRALLLRMQLIQHDLVQRAPGGRGPRAPSLPNARDTLAPMPA